MPKVTTSHLYDDYLNKYTFTNLLDLYHKSREKNRYKIQVLFSLLTHKNGERLTFNELAEPLSYFEEKNGAKWCAQIITEKPQRMNANDLIFKEVHDCLYNNRQATNGHQKLAFHFQINPNNLSASLKKFGINPQVIKKIKPEDAKLTLGNSYYEPIDKIGFSALQKLAKITTTSFDTSGHLNPKACQNQPRYFFFTKTPIEQSKEVASTTYPTAAS